MFLTILRDDALRKKMGDASIQVIRENRGAAVRTIGYLKELLRLTATESMVNTHYKISTRNINDEVSPRMRPGDAVTQYLIQLSHGEDNNVLDWLVLSLLRVLSVLYEVGVRLKLSCYNHHLLPTTKLDCCVISIGNITVGGTGKTPTAQKVALMIRDMGYRVVILNRGYRSHWQEKIGVVSDGKKIYMTAYEAGDEAFLMAKQLPGIPVVIGKERAITGQYAVDKFKAEVIILDDGYQHWQLHRDLDVVLVDTLNMFGNGSILPRGTLREPLKNLSRADLFLLTKCDQSSPISRATLCDQLHRYKPNAPIVESIHNPCAFIEIADWYKMMAPRHFPLRHSRDRKSWSFRPLATRQALNRPWLVKGFRLQKPSVTRTIMIMAWWKCSTSWNGPSANGSRPLSQQARTPLRSRQNSSTSIVRSPSMS